MVFDRGAAIKLRDRLGRTPFNVAVDSGNEACAQFLHQVCGVVSTSFPESARFFAKGRPHASLVLTKRNAASGNEIGVVFTQSRSHWPYQLKVSKPLSLSTQWLCIAEDVSGKLRLKKCRSLLPNRTLS